VKARHPLLLAAALLASCTNTSSRPGIRLAGPSAVAAFHGLSTRDPVNLRAYMAVADERADDLRLLDAVDGKAVLAPGLILSLSVPTAPRPALLAAGGLHDAGAARADLLAVAPIGLVACDPASPAVFSGCVQVVATWLPATALATSLTLDLGKLPGGEDAAVLSLAVVPVPVSDGAGGWTSAPGQARLVAGLSGGRLLLADYARAADGQAIALVGAAIHALGFDAVALSASPDLVHLYAASPDPIGGVEGVAELDLSAAFDQPPAVRALDALAPTTAVLAARVRPFTGIAGVTSDPKLEAYGDEVVRIYAAREPTRCGPDQPLRCGLVTLDPLTGGLLPERKSANPAIPIAVPGSIIDLIAIYPPTIGSLLVDGTAAPDGIQGAYQKQATQVSDHWTSTLAAATSTNGAVYLIDLARNGLARDAGVLATNTGGQPARVQTAASSTPSLADSPWLALWDDRATTATPVPVHDATVMPLLVGMTPGYTSSDSWTLGQQSGLPTLAALRTQLQATADGQGLAWLAVQSSSGATADAPPYRGVARLYDPRLPIRVGDIAIVTPDDTARCPRGAFELDVTGILYPTADFPGGAVTVAPRAADLQPKVVEGGVQVPVDPHCLDGAGRSTGRVTFLGGGLVLTGATFGYAGRPTPSVRYTLPEPSWAALACPIVDGGDFLVGGAWQPPVCDAACRAACEQLLLARKARRLFYFTEQCASTDAECLTRWSSVLYDDPEGPALTFRAGWSYPDGTPGNAPPERGTFLSIATSAGEVPVVRKPQLSGTVTGAVLPSGLATFDRAGASKVSADGERVLVSYPGNQVLDFSPSQAANASTLHR
jgi:hypothetical protein